MCFTGGFALAMMVDTSVVAPVLAQPSAPFAIGGKWSRDVNLSPGDLAVVKERAAAGCEVLGLRFTKDPMVGQAVRHPRRASSATRSSRSSSAASGTPPSPSSASRRASTGCWRSSTRSCADGLSLHRLRGHDRAQPASSDRTEYAMPAFSGVDHVSFEPVTDLDRSERFYGDVFDLVRLLDVGYARILAHRPTGFMVAARRPRRVARHRLQRAQHRARPRRLRRLQQGRAGRLGGQARLARRHLHPDPRHGVRFAPQLP